MFNSSKKITFKSQNSNALNSESSLQNQAKSGNSVLDEFLLEIFIDFLNNEKLEREIKIDKINKFINWLII